MAKKVFKAYHQGQLMLLPPSLEELIEANHPARIVNQIINQIDELWQYARQVAAEELSDTEPLEFAQISPEKVQQTIEEIDQALKDKPVDKKVKQKLQYARKNWPKNLERYEQQEQQLGSRNNMSKSDPDASFMRMKEDHMKNGQLKPGYNLQLSTQHQFILNYTLHQSSTDTATLPAHMDSYRELFDQMPEVLTADAGYGSEENYHYLEQNRVEAFVKYNYFHLEQKVGYRRYPFNQTYLHYNEQLDCYYCPMGQPMTLCGKRQRKTDNGYLQTNHLYQAQNCRGCPMRGGCHKQEGNRIIEVNHRFRKYKEMAREKLLSELGIMHRKKRPAEVEAVFGCIKHNKGFRRFMLKGLRKVEVETGLLAIAHNLSKMVN